MPNSSSRSQNPSQAVPPAVQVLCHSHYATLQVPPTASGQEIRQAYRELSKLYHPDTTHLSVAYATERFQQLTEAYTVLSNPTSRAHYDRKLRQAQNLLETSNNPTGAPPQKQTLVQPSRVAQARSAYLEPEERPLSAGEVFAVVMLATTLIGCLVLAIVLGTLRGEMTVSPINDPEISLSTSIELHHSNFQADQRLPHEFLSKAETHSLLHC